jgi:hypothetical protein
MWKLLDSVKNWSIALIKFKNIDLRLADINTCKMYKNKKYPYKKPLSSNSIQGKSGLTEKNYRRQSFWQTFKFIIVGGLATSVHVGIFMFYNIS